MLYRLGNVEQKRVLVGFYPTPVRGALFEILTTRAASTVGLVTIGG